jgi:hypothetical protein
MFRVFQHFANLVAAILKGNNFEKEFVSSCIAPTLGSSHGWMKRGAECYSPLLRTTWLPQHLSVPLFINHTVAAAFFTPFFINHMVAPHS